MRAVSLERESISPARANTICPSVTPCILSDHTSTGSKVWSKCELSNFFSYFVRSAQEALYVMGQNKTHTQRTHSENTQEHPGNTQRQPREYSAPIERPENTQRTPREQQENIHTYVRRTPSFLSIMGLYICSVISCTQIFVMNAYEVI